MESDTTFHLKKNRKKKRKSSEFVPLKFSFRVLVRTPKLPYNMNPQKGNFRFTEHSA